MTKRKIQCKTKRIPALAPVRLVIAMIAAGITAAAQTPAPPASTPPVPAQDPLNRTSPQSAVLGFLDACHAGNFQRAIHYLDLKQIPSAERLAQGTRLSQQLEQILNGDAQFDVAALSRDPGGDHQDGLAGNRERLITLQLDGKAVDLELERKELRSGVSVWVVASDSLPLIPPVAAATSESPIERRLPAVLVNYKLLDTSLWRWLALVLLALGISSLSRLLSRLVLLTLTPLLKRITTNGNWGWVESLLGPLQLLLCAAVFGAGMQWVDPSAVVRLYLRRGVVLVSALGLVWLAARILDIGVVRVGAALDRSRHVVSRSALPLLSRALKVVILLLGLVGVLSSWGYDTTTLLAGLGIGGVAIALAAQKTIENLFGSVAVVSDRPVSVGDTCKFGDTVGTVEDIGLRSTRIRTADRTLVTVPNGQFSSMTLENFSRRDKLLFHITLNLRRDTTPNQVRTLLAAVREILKDPKIETGPIPVRFVGVGAYSLDLEVFAYVLSEDGDEFLKVQQELLLRILDAVAAAGTALALPTQASVEYIIEGAPGTSAGGPSAGPAPAINLPRPQPAPG